MSQKIYRDIIRDGKVLRGQIFVPYNGKIADITHADTDKHTLDLATALGETRKIIAAILPYIRITGTSELISYPNEGTCGIGYNGWGTINFGVAPLIVIANGTQRLQYSLGAANDDFDLYCLGYVVEA